MEGSTRVDYITVNISDQDSDSSGEVTSDGSIDSDQWIWIKLEYTYVQIPVYETSGQKMHILWCLQGTTCQNHHGMYKECQENMPKIL